MIKKAFNTVYEFVPLIILIWTVVCLLMNDYHKAAYLTGTLAILLIVKALDDINKNLLRIANNTDLSSKTIVFTQSTKKNDKSE